MRPALDLRKKKYFMSDRMDHCRVTGSGSESRRHCSVHCIADLFIHFINSSIFINMTGLSYEMMCAASLFFAQKGQVKTEKIVKEETTGLR